MKGTTELRVTDSTFRDNKDHIFGFVKGSSTLIRGSKGADGKARPNVQVNTKIGKEADDAKVQRFLRGEILADGSETEGFIVEDEGEEYGEGEGLWLVNWVINQDSGKWTAEQVRILLLLSGKRIYVEADSGTRSGASRLLTDSAVIPVALSLPKMANMKWLGSFMTL